MSDEISQDQIDSLLNQQEAGGFDVADVGDDEPEEVAGERDYVALSAAFEFFNEQAAGVITTVLNREVELSVMRTEKLVKETMAESVPGPLLSLTLPLEGGINGSMYLIMGTAEVALLSDLMMMGDGTAEYTEDHKDAIAELLNQVMGNYVGAIGERFVEPVTAGAIQVKEHDFAESDIDLENADMVITRMRISESDDKTIGFIVPTELSGQMCKGDFGGVAGDGGGDTGGAIGLSASEVDDLTGMTDGVGTSDEDVFGISGAGEAPGVSRAPKGNVDMLLDVELDVCIELGRANLSIKRVLELSPGSLVELDRMAGEPVDLKVNDKVVAKGEVVVVDESFGIRIVSLVSPEERIKSLQ